MATDDVPVRRSSRLSSAEELRAYAHPTRMAILNHLAEGAQTLSQVARILDVHPANLSRHFRMLENAGLIVLVEKRDTGRNLEKYYKAVAARFEPDFEGLSPAGKREMALCLLRDELSDAILRVHSGLTVESETLVLLKSARLHPKDVAVFARKLQKLVEEFAAHDKRDGASFHLGLSLFPALHDAMGGKEIRIEERRSP